MSERPPRRPIRVLVVDDDPSFRGLCVEGLGRRGRVAPLATSTLGGALAALRERTVDAVVSDVALAGADGDGVDLYRAVREQWPALPFVFFTGTPAARLSVRVDPRRGPAVGYVRKRSLPERYDSLGRRVGRAVETDHTVEPGPPSVLRAVEEFCR